MTTAITKKNILTFIAITIFYFFESAQMSYFNVLAPYFLAHAIYAHAQIGSLSAAYYYGDVIGLLPVGFMLDRYPLRKILLWAIMGSIIAAFLLFFSTNFYMQWIARFFCGFFGGTFSFIGGIHIISALFSKRFTLFIGFFLSAGMLGGLICQYPLLIVVKHFGIQGAMLTMACFGLLVILFNFLFLHPIVKTKLTNRVSNNYQNIFYTSLFIIKNIRNWLDCVMVILLDTPVSVVGTLWGIVILVNVYHFSDAASALIVMTLFVGLIIGLPLWGALADRFNYPAWIVVFGASVSLVTLLMMIFLHITSAWLISFLFFTLGFFSSCQTLGFTWLTKNMKPELIGTNSAFNSMIFMSANGGVKQLSGYLLSITSIFVGHASGMNVLIFMASAMLLTVIYVLCRKKLI